MILDAEQARERAKNHTATSELVERIMQDIFAQSGEGKFHLAYQVEGENNYTIRHVAEALHRLGYRVVYSDGVEGVLFWIDWEK